MSWRTKLLAGAAMAAFVAPGAALADPATDAKIDTLEAQVKALTDALNELKAEQAQIKAASESSSDQIVSLKEQTASNIAALRADATATGVSLANGRPTIASSDGAFTASFRGVFQLDAAHYDQRSPGSLATDFRRGSLGDATEADHARDLSDGANFRRARIGIEGRAFNDFEYNFLYDFGGSGVEEAGKITSAWVQYDGLGKARIRVGAYSAPAGIEEATSTNGSLFFERASPSETVRSIASGDGRVSAGVLANGDTWNVSAVLTGNTVTNLTFDEQLGFVGRAAWTPYKRPDSLIHLGVNTSIVINPAATAPDVGGTAATPVRLRDRPEIRVDGARLIDTGNIDANGVQSFGGEFAAQHRNLYAQAEYFDIKLDRKGPLSNPHFSGWYVQGAWTLTGEPRRYGIATATFDAPKIANPFDPKKGQWGAWELAARYSDLDLNYHQGAAGMAQAADAVRGGEQKIFTLGLNWYLNSVVRFQADFQHVNVDRLSPGGTAFGAGTTPPAGAQIGQKFNIYALRTQYAF